MKRYERLYETLDQPLKWKWVKKNSQALFKLDEDNYIVVNFVHGGDTPNGPYYAMEFYPPTKDEVKKNKFRVNIEGGEEMGIQNVFKFQFKVFSTIADILKHFLEGVEPAGIGFVAKEPSRIRLYGRFKNAFMQKSNYRFLAKSEMPDGMVGFVYKRKDIFTDQDEQNDPEKFYSQQELVRMFI